MINDYCNMMFNAEKIHRLFLEVIKSELINRKIKNISNVQSLILFNMGEDEVNVGALTKGGYYQGTNVSYNLRHMVDNGYVSQQQSKDDRRSSMIRITDKGIRVVEELNDIFSKHSCYLKENGYDEPGLSHVNNTLNGLETFLNKRIYDR